MEIRELNWEMEFSTEERDAIAAYSISVDTLREFLRTSGPQNLDVAIGGILAIKEGKGQERNEPFVEVVGEPEIVVMPEASKLPEDGSATS